MITILRVLRVIFAAVGLWQIIGILPVLTWVNNPRAVTLGMAAGVAVKVALAAFCAGAFYWLGKVKRRRSTQRERVSDVAIAGISLAAVVIVIVVVALVLPTGRNSNDAEHLTSNSVAQAPPQPDTANSGSFDAGGWTQASTNSTEVGPWLDYDPPGTRYCRDADGTIQRVYPPGARPTAPRADPTCLHDSTRRAPSTAKQSAATSEDESLPAIQGPWKQARPTAKSSANVDWSKPTPVKFSFLQRVQGDIWQCMRAGGKEIACYVDGTPRRCQQQAINLFANLGAESRRAWGICVQSCDGSTDPECRRD